MMHVICVHGNLTPTSADMVLRTDRGRNVGVGVHAGDTSFQFKNPRSE
jgi:hypothetical protein